LKRCSLQFQAGAAPLRFLRVRVFGPAIQFAAIRPEQAAYSHQRCCFGLSYGVAGTSIWNFGGCEYTPQKAGFETILLRNSSWIEKHPAALTWVPHHHRAFCDGTEVSGVADFSEGFLFLPFFGFWVVVFGPFFTHLIGL
jgi:hypothetical protein